MRESRDQKVIQMAWLTRDLDAAVDRWLKTTGAGPFYVVDQVPLYDVRYRGKPAELQMRVALALMGDIQIELIQQTSDGPSAYRDVAPDGGDAFHHVCVYPDNYDEFKARHEAMGVAVASEAWVDAKEAQYRFCYLDTRASLNCMLEITDYTTVQVNRWALMRKEAAEWDGKTDPVRNMSFVNPTIVGDKG